LLEPPTFGTTRIILYAGRLILSNHCIVIVDPYSSGAMLAEALQARRANCIAVESSPRLPQAMKSRFNPRAFADVIQHDGDLEKTLLAVRSHGPTHVVAGFESGVELAEQICQRLSLPGNDGRLSQARRDKFLMNEAVRSQGLRTAMQFRSSNVQDILDWIRDTLEWPVILKPPKSVASDHVFCCHGDDDVRRSAAAILSETNVLGDGNESVVVQEYLDGSEYAIDVVSYQGQKKTTAIWQYHPPASARYPVGYDAMTLLPYDGERQQALQSYAFDVLDALGVQFGPAHCELMWVAGEPVLVEAGARMSAGNNAVLSRTCGGICQLDETVETILAPDRFLATLNQPPQLQKRAANVFLQPQRQGRLIRVRGLEQLQQLATLHSMSISSKPGDLVGRVAGLITLIDADIRAIERDISTIRALESEGIFDVEPESP
jgi:biotin carboxylase